MYFHDLNAVTEKDLQNLIADKVSEDETLEYKEQLTLQTIDAKLEFLKDISSMANAKGGDFILGVREDGDHRPVETVALKDFNFDEWQRKMNDLCSAHLDPRLLGIQFREVRLATGGSAMVIRIPRPWTGPHIVKLKDENRFYIRVGNQKKVMSVPELRSAFLLPESVAQRMRNFRTERLAKIMVQETSVPLLGSATVVIHIFPLAAFNQPLEIDLNKLRTLPDLTVPLSHPGGWSPGFNFDGFICETRSANDKSVGYVQVFRNGCVEATDAGLLLERQGKKYLNQWMETEIAEAMARFLQIPYKLDVPPPFFAMLALLNVRGYIMYREMPAIGMGVRAVDRDQLVFAEEMVSDVQVDCFKLLKPSYDVLWQTCGYHGSPSYDEKGERRERRR